MLFDKWIAGGVGLVLLALLTGGFGIFLLFVLPPIIRSQIDEQTRLGFNASGSFTDTTIKWISPEYKLSMNIYTFSVTNPDRIIDGQKPIIVEKGPYSFREIQHKEVAFVQENQRVFYKNSRYYFFDPLASCANCSLGDIVTIPNIVLQNILDAVKGNLIYRSIFDAIFKETGEKVFITTNVRELLFDGYADPLISKWCVNLLKPICAALKIPERIGLFYQRNGTNDGKYEIDTGLNSASEIGKVYSFNDKKVVNSWYAPYAKMINGSDGQLFPPGLDKRDSSILQLFIGQICRTIELEYFETSDYQDVPVYLYQPAKSMNNVARQRELGFCNPASPIYFNNTYIQEKGCLPSGLLDLSSCLPGNPKIYMSQPHFYNSPSPLRDEFVGLRLPNAEDDGTVIGIEPASGAVVFANQRSQLNLGVINGGLLSLKRLPSRIMPLVWFNETAIFDSGTRNQLLGLSQIRSRSFIGGILLAVLFILAIIGIVAIVLIRKRRQQQNEHELLFTEEQDEPIEQIE